MSILKGIFYRTCCHCSSRLNQRKNLFFFSLLFFVNSCASLQAPIDTNQLTPSLKALAEKKGFFIGTTVAKFSRIEEATLYREILAKEFNIATPENSMKFGQLSGEKRGDYDFSETDAFVEFAEANDIKIRGHTLIWHSQLPRWLKMNNWTRDELISIMREHIQTVVGRYKDRLFAWDVVNEAVIGGKSLMRDSIWHNVIGPEYLDIAFRSAHDADPDALLFYNDYGIGFGENKLDKVYKIVKGMIERNVPIHGIGFQMHLNEKASYNPDDLRAAIRLIETLGLQVHITEMDVKIEKPGSFVKLQHQAMIYRQVLQVALEEPACTAFLMWGFTDRHSWIPWNTNGKADFALIFDEFYQPKPAYNAIKKLLAED